MNQQTKNFTFKEDNSKCIIHQEIIRYICQCSEKLCVKCLSESKETNSHLRSHKDFKLFHVKDLKNFYMNQVAEIETILREICEAKEKNPHEGSSFKAKERKNFINEIFAFKDFKNNLLNLVNFQVERYLESLYAKEDDVVEEMLNLINSTDIILDSEMIIKSHEKFTILKEKGKLCALKTFEKINYVQNSFIEKIENFMEEFNFLLGKYLGKEEDNYYQDEELINRENETQQKIISNHIKISLLESEVKAITSLDYPDKDETESIKSIESTDSIKLSTNKSFLEIRKSNKEYKLEKSLGLNLNLNVSHNLSNNMDYRLYNLEDIPDSPQQTKNSILNTMTNFAEDANIFTNSNYKNIKSTSIWKEEIIPEISNSIEDISLYMKSNNLKQRENSNTSFNIDRKSLINEFNFNINKENRNRINNIIFYKKKKRIETLNRSDVNKANKKYKLYQAKGGQATPVNYNNQNPVHGFFGKNLKHVFQQPNGVTNQDNPYANYNGFGLQIEKDKFTTNNTNKVNYLKKMCVDCYTPFNVKNVNNWKKRCIPCQKSFYDKITNIKSFYSINSYKAGKMNQICSKCKNSFIVPVALAKQRKTCYYCFKNNANS